MDDASALDVRLFYSDPWLTECDATVVAVKPGDGAENSRMRVLLDRTIFYPEGGGQPSDQGFMQGYKVTDVQEIDGQIWHSVDVSEAMTSGTVTAPLSGVIKPGAYVHLVLDWERRFYHMQQHTGQHLLSAVLEQEYGIHTISFHLGTENCTIDIAASDPLLVPAQDVEVHVDRWIERDVPVRVHYCPPEDLASFRLRKKPPGMNR